MGDTDDATDGRAAVETLVKRDGFLDRLASGPTTKRDLRDDLDVSRSTVYKAVRELEDADLVAEVDEGVRLTLYGRLLVERYRSFVETVEAVDRHESLLAVLPPDAPVTADVAVGAECVIAERHAPNRPVGRIEELVGAADRVVAATPVVLPQYVDLFHRRIVSEGMTADLVLEAPVAEYLTTDHAEKFGEALDTGRLDVSVTDESLPFGLVDRQGDREELVLIVYDEGGDLRGVIVNDTPAALDWARDVFRTFRANADGFDLA